MKYIKVTYFECLKSPIHLVEGWEIKRTTNVVQPFEELDSFNFNAGEVGDKWTVEIIEMTQKEFDKLREFKEAQEQNPVTEV